MSVNSPGASLGTVLGVWAHPDDEAYLSSGLMAQAAASGSRVVCVTATRGEGGSLDPERWPPESLGDIRAAELQRCLSLLGVEEHIFLELPDVDSGFEWGGRVGLAWQPFATFPQASPKTPWPTDPATGRLRPLPPPDADRDEWGVPLC